MSMTKIYVGNLSYSKDEGQLFKLFRTYGKVGKINIIQDPKTERSKGIAFLQMFGEEEAKKAITELNGKVVDGRTLKVSVAEEREPTRRDAINRTDRTDRKKEKPAKKPRRREKGLKVLFNHLGS